MKNIVRFFLEQIKFITIDIWRIAVYDEKGKHGFLVLFLKTVILSIRGFVEGRMNIRASALTYYSMFALIPILAFVFGIARGFGFDNVIIKVLAEKFPSQGNFIELLFRMVESYLNHAKGGVFVGIGICFLMWSVLNVFTQIEISFNEIWKIKKNRTFVRRFTDYISLMLLVPFLIIITSGLSIYFKYVINLFDGSYIVSPALKTILAILPFVITWLVFTMLYIIMPNTKVKFINAAVAGLVAGGAFQIFRSLYVYGQSWATSYNAVYGSFAALPLLMLFIQISWFIVLFGAEISFAGQSVRNFEYEKDVKTISHRYYEFVMLAITQIIIKKFERGEDPLTLSQLSNEYKIPLRLVTVMTNKLCRAKILVETVNPKDNGITYQPALDINKITVAHFFDMIDSYGSENFGLEKRDEFAPLWQYSCDIRKTLSRVSRNMLVKDI